MNVTPTLEVERALLAEAPIVIGMDEVGRGAIAGPVCVGAAAITAVSLAQGVPEGLRDSKLLTPARRELVAPRASEWARAVALGWASPGEIDAEGISRALGLAGWRALDRMHRDGIDVPGSIILLDGSFDWLSPVLPVPVRVVVRPKADRDCAAVAAASVCAKVSRDRILVAAHDREPAYDWAANKGYGSASHRAAIVAHGPSAEHRRTWLRRILPTEAPEVADARGAAVGLADARGAAVGLPGAEGATGASSASS